MQTFKDLVYYEKYENINVAFVFLLQTKRIYHKMFDLILTIICNNAALRSRFPLLERELTISLFNLHRH